MEEEFVANQERLKPQEDKNQEDRTKVDDLRGSPMSVGNLEEIIDENHAIVSSSVGPEYYVNVLSFVDKDQLEPGCSILLHNKVLSVVGLLQDEVDPMVSVMKVRTPSCLYFSRFSIVLIFSFSICLFCFLFLSLFAILDGLLPLPFRHIVFYCAFSGF